MRHTVHPFDKPALLANVDSIESSVRFKAACFCCTVDTRPSPGLLSDVLLLPQSCRSCSFASAGLIPSCAHSSSSQRGQALQWASSKPEIRAWLVAEFTSLPALLHPCHWGQISCTHIIGASSSRPLPGLHPHPASSPVLPRQGAGSEPSLPSLHCAGTTM